MEQTKLIHVGIYDTLADWEVGHALAHLGSGDWSAQKNGCRIVTVGEKNAPVRTKAGLRLTPDTTVAEVEPESSAMLILPGADIWLAGKNAAFAALAERFLDAGVPVAAICGATVGLAARGLLNHRAHTSNAPEVLAVAGDAYDGHKNYQHELVAMDGDLITANGIAPVEFAKAIFDRLGFYTKETSENWYRLYGEHDPAGYLGLINEHPPTQRL